MKNAVKVHKAMENLISNYNNKLSSKQLLSSNILYTLFAFLLFSLSATQAQVVVPAAAATIIEEEPAGKNSENNNPLVESIHTDPKAAKAKSKSKIQTDDIELIQNPWGVLKNISEKDKLARTTVNQDSIYKSYVTNRIFRQGDDPSYFVSKILSNAYFERLNNQDTSFYRYTEINNKYFSTFTIRNANEMQEMKRNYEMILQINDDPQVTTQQLLAEVLPPVPVLSKALSINQYKQLIENYFKAHPEVINVCSSEFLLLMVRKQFALMYALQLDSNNKLIMADKQPK